MLITDAQVHIWDEDRPDRPWPKDRVQAQREGAYTADAVLKEMDAVGVDRAVIVTPSWVGEVNATGMEAARKYPEQLAVMGRFDPRAQGAHERLVEWRKQPNMLGIRLTFMSPFSDLLDDPSLEWFWTTCEEQGIPLMAMVPRMLPKVGGMMEQHPNLTLILDHLGSPFGKGPEAFSHLDELEPMTARFPRLCVKWTSVPNFSQEPYPYRDIYPQLRRMYDMFGPKRIFWGSDITRLASSYKECLEHVRESLDFLSAEDKEWILGRAISETLGWPTPIETASSSSN